VSAVGLDLFAGMLAVARTRYPEISWVRGDANRMPFRSESFDYATNQFSYHHIREKSGFVREAFRVLTPGGRFVMTNIDRWAMPNWILYQFFPEARDLDHRDFLPAESFAYQMRGVGFGNVRITRDRRRTREPIAEFLAYARQRHRASQFIALPDDHYRAGVRRVERAVADAANAQAAVDSEFCLLTIGGDKPPTSGPALPPRPAATMRSNLSERAEQGTEERPFLRHHQRQLLDPGLTISPVRGTLGTSRLLYAPSDSGRKRVDLKEHERVEPRQ
jgi:ubiquinone/menaquinone biosynthesis C-methylase UbiE